MHSYNYGATWSNEVIVGHPYTVEDLPPRMIYCSGSLLFAYTGNPDSGGYEDHIIGYRSTDAGRTWSDTIWISPHSHNLSLSACLACNYQRLEIAACYFDYRYQIYSSHGDVFTRITDDLGGTWPFEYQATHNHTAFFPQVDFVADTLITVWSDMRYYDEGKHEIFFNRSNNGGLTWQGEERITNTPGQSYDPWVSFDNGKIHVVWWDEAPDSGYEIYYKRFIPDSTEATEEPVISPPVKFSISAYPNPFNSSITIEIETDGPGQLNIYDIQGRIVIAYPIAKGGQNIVWDATDAVENSLSSGTYFARVTNGNKSNCIKLIFLK
jgi:hypothetical protein